MEQLTLNLTEVKQEIREKLQQTAENFVFIGYRLRQILDSGAHVKEGYADIYEFAKAELSLGKSAVSRFMAINEKYSAGGYGPELREEYRNFGSSKLSEMLSLTDAECSMVGENTTIAQIRDYKQFKKEEPKEEVSGQQSLFERPQAEGHDLLPLLKDYFSNHMELLRKILFQDITAKELCDAMNPGGTGTYKHKFVFLMMNDFGSGVAYKVFGRPQPEKLTWQQLHELIKELLAEEYEGMAAAEGERERREKEAREREEERRQQEKIQEELRKKEEQERREKQKKREEAKRKEEEQKKKESAREEQKKAQEEPEKPIAGQEEPEEQIPGQDSILNHPEYLPENMETEDAVECCDVARSKEEENWIEMEMAISRINAFIEKYNGEMDKIPRQELEDAARCAWIARIMLNKLMEGLFDGHL